MEDLDQGDGQTFNINFSADGVAKLRERVTDKLQEFMGDYTDDTLVEYVIVLLKNGRHKEEAKNELNVFLGSDSDSFVSWLWNHLSTNLHLYAQVPESYIDETTKGIPLVGVEAGREPQQLDVESEREKSTKGSKSRRNREWKGLVSDATETPPLRSSEIEIFHPEERNHKKYSRAKRSHSPRPVQRKRNRQDDRYEPKKEVPSHPTIAPPSRILQFAMRDAVGTIRSSSLKTEPTSKRLRSVVSTSTGDLSLENQPSRIRSVARVSSAMTSAINAAAAAAEDVTKLRGSVNVFDRLDHGLHVSEITTQSPCFKRSMIEGSEHEDFDRMEQVVHPDYLRRNEDSTENMMLDRHVAIAYDSNSDNEYDDGISVGDNRKMDASLSGWTSGYRNDKGSYSTTKNTNDVMRTQVKDQGPPSSMANNSRKILNISVNVNTWKPPQYQVSGDSKVENLKAVHESKVSTGKLDGRLVKEKSNTVMDTKENEKSGSDIQKKTQSILPSNNGSNSASRSSDADSGTIFVSNVHFAATKDSLSRHFNKFGEVLKVVIVTDAATGQPKGSAYIEFLRKEAAELALSLNGTSFMSRILKVVKKSSSSQEVNPVMTWPHTARGSPFPGRGTRVAFPRGQPMFRTRQPIKSGPRSLQWKRGSPAAPAVEGSNSQNGASLVANNVQSPSPRSLTYVRTAAKPM